jgi:hypothetical protein
MARLTKANAARQLGIARSTLYKLIDQGVLSAMADGMIDSSELVRVATFADTLKQRSRTSADVFTMDAHSQAQRHLGHLVDSDRGRSQTPVYERPQTTADNQPETYADILIMTLREQLRATQETAQREHEAAQERERAYQARNEHSCHSRQSRVFPLSSCAINLRFEHPVFHPMICYFKVLFTCATSRATINVPPDLCYERFWHRLLGGFVASHNQLN